MEPLTAERLKQANEIVKKINLPAQPRVVIEIGKEMGAEEPDFNKIAGLVSQDAALAAKVIHVINSPFFGLVRKVESIIQALSLMGLQNFHKVILTTCLREALGGGSSESDELFWNHSQRSAVAAEHLANSLGSILMLDNISSAQVYMAALFHDSAIPIFLKRSGEYQSVSTLALSHKQEVTTAEEALAGTDHCCVGAMMAKSWSLPTDVCKAILHHHVADLETIKKDEAPAKLIAAIQLADYVSYTYDFSIGAVGAIIEGDWDTEEWSEMHGPMLDELHLGPDDVNDLKMEIFDRLSR